MKYIGSSHLALAMLAGTLIAEPASAHMPGPPSPPSVSVPSVPSVRPPSINVPNVTPNINTQIRDSLPRGGRGSTSSGRSYDDDRSAKRSGGERRANRSGGDNSGSRANVGGQAAAAAADDSPGDGSKAAYEYSDQTAAKYDMDNCDPSNGDYVPSGSGRKPMATFMPVSTPSTTIPSDSPSPPFIGPLAPINLSGTPSGQDNPPMSWGNSPGGDPSSGTPPASSGTANNVDVANNSSGGTSDDSSSRTKKPALTDQPLVLSGPDGGSSTLVVHTSTVDLTPKQVDDVKYVEQQKYGDDNDPNQQYKPVTSQPSDKQDCAGNAMENLFGIKDVVVGAENFYNNIIKPLSVPVDRSNVAPNDVGVFFNQSGTPGHIVTVKSVDGNNITIISKDGKERVRQGVLNDSAWSKFRGNDGIVNQYGGDIKFYRINNPNAIQINAQGQ
jgi:hypothetical protein